MKPYNRMPSPNNPIKITMKNAKKGRKNKTVKKQKMTKKELIQRFKVHGIKTIETLKQKELVELIHFANDTYYNEAPLLTDNEYDIIKEYAESKYPKNKALKAIGAPVQKNKVTLPYFMASMDKIKPNTEALTKWRAKYKGNYVLSAKLDGVSGLYVSENGNKKLYTRGDGRVGQDVSHMIPYLKLPSDKELAVRGEFIIKKTIFQTKYAHKFANSRNLVSGIVNSKSIDKEKLNDIDFVCYEVIKPELTPSSAMSFLETEGFLVVQNETREDVTNDYLSKNLLLWRKNYSYEIDGIICTNNDTYVRKEKNPEHAFAFKMVISDQVAEAKVVDVLWSPSKDGLLKPRIRIEPIHLGGVKIEYATAFNAGFVEQHKLGIGAVVKLIRSGDVIPHIMEVVEKASQAKMPDEDYEWNSTHVDIVLRDKNDNDIVKTKNIVGFFKGIGVDGLSTGNVEKIYKAGFKSVHAIVHMSLDNFMTIEGFQEKLSSKIYNSIKSKLQNATLVKIMSSSNIFGHGMAERKLDLIMKAEPQILNSTELDQIKIEKIAKIKGMATKTAELFVKNIPDFLNFLNETKLTYKLDDATTKEVIHEDAYDEKHVLYGKNIVMTGFRDVELSILIEKHGARVTNGVNKKTFAVIVKENDFSSAKTEQAQSFNIPIMLIEEFKTKYFSSGIL